MSYKPLRRSLLCKIVASVNHIIYILQLQWSFNVQCFFSTGDQDAGSSGYPLRSVVDALPDSGFDQLFCVHTISGCLVPVVLSDMHLCQQCYQPCDIQCHVSEVPLGISRAVSLPAARWTSEDTISNSDRLLHSPRLTDLPAQQQWN